MDVSVTPLLAAKTQRDRAKQRDRQNEHPSKQWSRRHTDISHDTSTYIDKREYRRALGNFGPFWYDNGKASQLQITASMRLLYNLLRNN